MELSSGLGAGEGSLVLPFPFRETSVCDRGRLSDFKLLGSVYSIELRSHGAVQ